MTNCFQITGKDSYVKSHVYQLDLEIFLTVMKKNGQTARVEFNKAYPEGFKVNLYYSQILKAMIIKFFPLLQHILKQQLGIPEKASISDFHRLFFTVDERFKKRVESQRGVWRIGVPGEFIDYVKGISKKMENVQGASLEYKFATDLDFSYSLFEKSVNGKQGMQFNILTTKMRSNMNIKEWAIYQNGKNYQSGKTQV